MRRCSVCAGAVSPPTPRAAARCCWRRRLESPLDPHFGPGSAAAHAASGARPLSGDWPGLRHDVDTALDLDTVLALGTGPYTCGLLRDLGLTAGCGVPAR